MSRPGLAAILAVAAASVIAVFSGVLAQAPAAGKRYAVLVGVKEYDHVKLKPLDYPENDVDEMAAILGQHKYDVTLLTNTAGRRSEKLIPTLSNIETRLAEVLEKCRRNDTVIVALAGHGLQFEKQKPTDPDDAYFCPQDAKPLADRRETLLSLQKLYKRLDESGAGVKLLLVDACRDDPVAGRGRGVDGSTSPRPPQGVAALFSCSAGERAFESDKLKHGVFFHFVLEGMRGKAKDADGEVTWDGLQTYVRKRVQLDVAGLVGGGVRQTPTLNAGELAGQSPVIFALGDVQQPPPPQDDKTYTSKTTGMKFVRIPKGTFTMGSSRAEQEDVAKQYFASKRQDWMDEESAHEVTISKDFYLGVHEVTRGEFRKFVEAEGFKTEAETDGKGGRGLNLTTGKWEDDVKYDWWTPGFTQNDSHPVVNVSWNDAVKYAEWLSKKDGREYRLPTEAEWEYACRGGSTSRYSFGDEDEDLAKYGNVSDASAKSTWRAKISISADDGYAYTAPVGRFKSNKFGLYDMHGNVWEWCSDWYEGYGSGRVTDPTGPATGSFRVGRGGGWSFSAWLCRSAFRIGFDPSFRDNVLGFRLSLVPSGR